MRALAVERVETAVGLGALLVQGLVTLPGGLDVLPLTGVRQRDDEVAAVVRGFTGDVQLERVVAAAHPVEVRDDRRELAAGEQ